MRGLGLGFPNPVETGGVWHMCPCLGCGGVSGVGKSGVVTWSSVWDGASVMYVCVL